MEKKDKKDLEKRYLVWLYKTTREAFDRIERKFTQLEIDRFILKELIKSDKDKKARRFIEEFNEYIRSKEKEAVNLKYKNKDLKPDYRFLALKLRAIEKAITRKLGKAELRKIKEIYTQEMLRRIIEERAVKT